MSEPFDSIGFIFLLLTGLGLAFSRTMIGFLFSFFMGLVGVASFFLYLQMPYLAAIQLVFYVGGVFLLFIFALFSTVEDKEIPTWKNHLLNLAQQVRANVWTIIFLLGLVLFVSPYLTLGSDAGNSRVYSEDIQRMGDEFLKNSVLSFEFSSLILLSALVSALFILKKMQKSFGEKT